MPDELTLDFTTDELYLLYSFFGPAIAFGLGEPYLGKFIEEIEAAQRTAQQSLAARDLIRLAENGEITVDAVLAKMIETCAQPSHTLIVTTQRRDYHQVIRYLRFGPEMLVEHMPLDATTHRLVALPPAAGYTRLAKILHLDEQGAAPGSAFSLEEQELFQARDAVFRRDPLEAERILSAAGLPEPQPEQLVRALSNALSNSSIAILANRNGSDAQHVGGIGILESAEGLWSMNLQPNAKKTRFEFVPSSAAEIAARVQGILPLRQV